MDKVREEFEKWAKQFFKLEVEDWGEYVESETQWAWFAWRASRESLCIELPSSYNSDGDPWFAGYNCALEDVVDILKETGVNYK